MNYKKIIRSQKIRFKILDLFHWIPDRPWLKLLFRIRLGYWMDFDNPKTFNEKLQWLKVYGFRPEYTQMVDKYAAKDYVASKIGDQYIIPTLGVWENPEDIDWNTLPEKFVLKLTTGGGSTTVWIVKNKFTFDSSSWVKMLRKNYPELGKPHKPHVDAFREHPYDNVPVRIIAEQFMVEKDGQLRDYKFYCFNGNAYKVMVCYDRGTGDTKFYSFDKEWNLLRHNTRGINAPKDFSIPKPQRIEDMFAIAETLAKNIPFVRVDLYNVDGQIYFGELTLYPASGFDKNILPEIDNLYGSMIELPR